MEGVPFPAAPHTSSLLVLVWLQSNVKHVSADAVMNRAAKTDAASPFSPAGQCWQWDFIAGNAGRKILTRWVRS